jgi:hypothetical protein
MSSARPRTGVRGSKGACVAQLGCGTFYKRSEKAVASGAASVRAMAPGAWRRRPPTWSITSSPGCRCGSGCSRFRSRFACCSLLIPSCSRPSCRSSTASLPHFVLYLIEALHPCNFGSDPTSRTPTRRSPHRRRHADPALRIGRHQIAGSDFEQPKAGPNGVKGRDSPE